MAKGLSICDKLWFSYPYIFVTQVNRHKIIQTMTFVRAKNLEFEISKVCTIMLQRYWGYKFLVCGNMTQFLYKAVNDYS